MSNLFPSSEPYRTGMLAVDGIHTLHYEESGNPQGPPVLYLHGGPGVGLTPLYRRLFDPSVWRIIGLDQRGSGQSLPYAETTANSPAHLLSDIEHLRLNLGIERWHVHGGSWGTTLGLAYAASYPEKVLSLVLRSVFLMQASEIDWFMHGIKTIRPEAWDRFVETIPLAARDGDALLDTYLEQLLSPDPTVHMPAARRWFQYEISCSTLIENKNMMMSPADEHIALSMARLEAYYFKHHRFQPDDWLLRAADAYRGIPGIIIQGQYDVICPPINAHKLHLAWPEAEYVVVPDAGHSAMEPGITRAIIAATERMKHVR